MTTTPASHRVAAIQMVSGDSLQANLDAASRLVAEAARRGAQLVALPEYFYLMPADEPRRVALAEPFGDGPIQRHLAGLARTHRVWLIGGTVPLQSLAPGRMYNSSLLFDPQGECAARYDKVHLFGFHHGEQHYDEAATMCAGREPVVASTPLGRLKLSVCYDLRFPEFYRLPPAPELIAAPAAFTRTTGEAHWELLLRARAVENLAYVIAAGQGGEHPGGKQTFGHSMIVDPWGKVLDCVASGEGIALADIDLALQAELRCRLPALSHRVFP